jgi:hypothetical protein
MLYRSDSIRQTYDSAKMRAKLNSVISRASELSLHLESDKDKMNEPAQIQFWTRLAHNQIEIHHPNIHRIIIPWTLFFALHICIAVDKQV